jgi:fructokinase
VGSGPENLVQESFPTGDDPHETLSIVAAWFGDQQRRLGRKLAGIGIGSFGPVDLRRASLSYGFITTTPKRGWARTNVLGALSSAFPGLPIGFDTDVNAAALGEHTWGNGRGLDDFVYITVGTGIGAGAMVGGRLLHGLVHPEMGHMLLTAVAGDTFEGSCPFHGRCWEGVCSGTALARRAGSALADLPAEHPCWSIAATYMGRAIANIVCVLSPRRVILGGSVRKAGRLGSDRFFSMIRGELRDSLRGYISAPELDTAIQEFVVPPLLGDDAGVLGALALATRA